MHRIWIRGTVACQFSGNKAMTRFSAVLAIPVATGKDTIAVSFAAFLIDLTRPTRSLWISEKYGNATRVRDVEIALHGESVTSPALEKRPSSATEKIRPIAAVDRLREACAVRVESSMPPPNRRSFRSDFVRNKNSGRQGVVYQ